MISELTPERQIKKAIIKLQVEQPFFAHLSMYMKPIESEQCPTMGVDASWNLFYNPNFIKDKIVDIQTLTGCMCHETLHLAFNHIGRIGQRNHNISNIAMDMVVNMICVKNSLKIVQGDGYVNVNSRDDTATIDLKAVGDNLITIYNVTEKSWERIYEEILPQLKDIKNMESKVVVVTFDQHMHESFSKLSKEEQHAVVEKAKQILTDAFTYAKSIGKEPNKIERYVKELLKPRISWKVLLNKYIRDFSTPNDFTYRKPHRKSYHTEIFMPNVTKENVIIEVLVDTSGSISEKDYIQFITELYTIMRCLSNVKIFLTFVDCDIGGEYVLNSSNREELFKIKPKGCGGTDMEVGLDHIKNTRRNSPVVFVLTDGYTTNRKSARDYPFEVVWILNNERMKERMKYGRVVVMQDE